MKLGLLSSVSLLIGLFCFNSAQSQEAKIEEVVIITGSKQQIKSDIAKRLNSPLIIDSLSQDDIGALPDFTIAESLRRITGVTTIYNDDIGQFASIRGVHPNFVPVTVNGLSIATTGDLGEGVRMVNLQVIPAVAVKSLDAYKTPTPDLDAGAMGGLLDIVPISAFDKKKDSFIGTIGLTYSSYMDVPDTNSWGGKKNSPYGPFANILFAKKFGKNGELGIAFTGMVSDRPRTQSNDAITNRLYYTASGTTTTPTSASWNGIGVPNSFLNHLYTNNFHKDGGTLKLDYRPNDKLRLGFYLFAYYSNEEETRNTIRLFSLDLPQNLTFNSGSMRVKSVDTQWRYNTFERDQSAIQFDGQYYLENGAKFSAKAGHSFATFLSDRPFVSFAAKPNFRVNYDLNNENQRFVLENPSYYTTPSNYTLSSTFRDWRATKEYVDQLKIDYSKNNSIQDRGLGFAFGLDVRKLNIRRDITSINYVMGTPSLDGLAFVQDFNYIGYPYPSLWIDADKFWNTTVKGVAIDAAASDYASRISDYKYIEDNLAAYFSINKNTDKYQAQIGARYDYVSAKSSTPKTLNGVIQSQLAQYESENSNLLPYFNIVYQFSPEIRIKSGLSKTLGRPNPNDIASAEMTDKDNFYISRGNPDIKPRQSVNFDFGFEKFLANKKGMVTLTGFSKYIEDDILTISDTQTIGNETWTISQPINGETTKISGVELGYANPSLSQTEGFFSKLGVLANFTYVKGRTAYRYNGIRYETSDLVWLSNYMGNAAVFYDFGGGSEIRFSANYKSGYKEELATNFWQDLYIEPFTTYDLNITWAISDNMQIKLEGRNITDENRYRMTGPNHEYLRAGLEIGSTWLLRFVYKN